MAALDAEQARDPAVLVRLLDPWKTINPRRSIPIGGREREPTAAFHYGRLGKLDGFT